MQNVPWNKGRLTGQKRPLKPKDVGGSGFGFSWGRTNETRIFVA
jgi:hypothetical protein